MCVNVTISNASLKSKNKPTGMRSKAYIALCVFNNPYEAMIVVSSLPCIKEDSTGHKKIRFDSGLIDSCDLCNYGYYMFKQGLIDAVSVLQTGANKLYKDDVLIPYDYGITTRISVDDIVYVSKNYPDGRPKKIRQVIEITDARKLLNALNTAEMMCILIGNFPNIIDVTKLLETLEGE